LQLYAFGERAAQVEAVDRPVPAWAVWRAIGIGAADVAIIISENKIIFAAADSGGVIDSYGTNKVGGNGVNGAPTNTIAVK